MRVSEEEKAEIEMLAARTGGSTSAYVLQCALHTPVCPNTLKQDIARSLCELEVLLENVQDVHTKKLVSDWGASVWQFLKS